MFVYALKDNQSVNHLHHGRVLINLAYCQIIGVALSSNQNEGGRHPWQVVAYMDKKCHYVVAEFETKAQAEQVLQSVYEALKHGKPTLDLAVVLQE